MNFGAEAVFHNPVASEQPISQNELLLFCEWLAHLRINENDMGAGITHFSISRYIGLAASRALKDKDMEDYKRWTNLRRKIDANWDSLRAIKALNEE